jgi:hypothetical protein
MRDTMRDLLSKLDSIVSETALQSQDDLDAKRKALQDLQMDPTASGDPEIKQAIMQRKADLEREAKSKGFTEGGVDFDKIRADASDHIKKSIDKQSDDRIAKLKADREKGDEPFMAQVGRKIIGGVKGAVKGGIKGAARGFSGKESIEEELFQVGDAFGISFSEDHEIATTIVDILEDGIVIELDNTALDMLTNEGLTFLEGEVVNEEKQKGVDGKACWKGYKRMGTKQKGGKTVDNCVKMGEDSVEESGLQRYTGIKKYGKDGFEALQKAGREGADEEEKGRIKDKYLKKEDADVDEAKYQGREVPLGKKMAGDVKKSKVYVRKPNGNIVKVNFGDKKMRIKKSNPARRKSFRARHNCKNPGPRWKARYWSCRSW